MTTPKPTAEQKLLAASLDKLSTKIGAAYRPLNDNTHTFERTGWLVLRAAVALIESGDKAHGLAADWAARGYPLGATDDPKVNGGHDIEKLNGVESASQYTDDWELRRDQLALLRRLLDDNAKDIEWQIAETIKVMPNEGRRSTLIDCANPHCETSMTGLDDDRPRAGRCERCYRFRLRNNRDWTPNGLNVAS